MNDHTACNHSIHKWNVWETLNNFQDWHHYKAGTVSIKYKRYYEGIPYYVYIIIWNVKLLNDNNILFRNQNSQHTAVLRAACLPTLFSPHPDSRQMSSVEGKLRHYHCQPLAGPTPSIRVQYWHFWVTYTENCRGLSCDLIITSYYD